jgi:hypothetical protein
LVIALRETPLDSITLENALKLSTAGAIIAPVSPGFYMDESSISDLADSFSNKILTLIGIKRENGWRADHISSNNGTDNGEMTSGELATYDSNIEERNLSDLEKEVLDALLLGGNQSQSEAERLKTALDKLKILKSPKKDDKE